MKSDLFEPQYSQGIAATLTVLSCLAFVLNSCVIIIFLGNRSLLTSSNYILLSMAVSDWLKSTFVTTVGAYANAKHWWTLDDVICQYVAFSSTVLGLTSMMHIMALAVEKWIILKKAAVNDISERNMASAVCGLWFFSFLWSLFSLLGWSSFGPEPGYAGCSVTWNSSIPSDKAYIVFLFMFFFLIPVAIATYCYIRIYTQVRKLAANAIRRWGFVAQHTQTHSRQKPKL
jgi:hypothetical protein